MSMRNRPLCPTKPGRLRILRVQIPPPRQLNSRSEGPYRIGKGPLALLRADLRDYRFLRAYYRCWTAPQMPSMDTAPVWITGRMTDESGDLFQRDTPGRRAGTQPRTRSPSGVPVTLRIVCVEYAAKMSDLASSITRTHLHAGSDGAAVGCGRGVA